MGLKCSSRLRRWWCLTAAALAWVLTLGAAAPAAAAPWMTFGGTPERQNQVTEPVGALADRDHWRTLDLGQSATQPLLVDNRIYYLAGLGLFAQELDPTTGDVPPPDPDNPGAQPGLQLLAYSAHHPLDPHQPVRVSSSTPAYSPHSGHLYWGTAYGQLRRLNPQTGVSETVNLGLGCEVVSSPLVLRDGNRDLVVLGQKPRGECTEPGKIYLVWGLDGVGAPGWAEFRINGWATPSPVQAPAPPGEPLQVIVGADGTGCDGGNGHAMKLRILPTGDSALPYLLVSADWGPHCVPKGVAGGFTVHDGYAYWVDVAGVLWGRRLSDGQPPTGWPADHIPLAPLVEGSATATAFTNTSPAIDAATGTAYITLRNYWPTHDPDQLRAPPTGSAGAVVAIDLATGARRWAHKMPAAGPPGGEPVPLEQPVSINTNPLVLRSQGVLVFGDVHGWIHSLRLDDGAPGGLLAASDRLQPGWSVLRPGETPARGWAVWSQAAGAGTEPAVASGTLGEGKAWFMVGANWQPADADEDTAWRYGRLVLAPFGATYNLAWDGSGWAAADADTGGGPPPGVPNGSTTPFTIGQAVRAGGTVTLGETDLTLGELRSVPPVRVGWYLVPRDWDGSTAQVRCLPAADRDLPGGLRSGQQVEIGMAAPFTVAMTDPEEGHILGVVDPVGLARRPTTPEGWLAAQLLAACAMDEGAAVTPAHVAELATLPGAGGGAGGGGGGGDGSGGPGSPATAANGLADNFLWLPYQRHGAVDLAIELEAPGAVACAPPINLRPTWTVTNHATTDVTAVIQVHAQAGGTAEPKTMLDTTENLKTGQTKRWTGALGATCGQEYTIRAEVRAADDSVTEERYDNNTATATVAVAAGAPEPELKLEAGRGRVMIVDPTCVSNPDPTSSQPCSNLDLTLPPEPGQGWP